MIDTLNTNNAMYHDSLTLIQKYQTIPIKLKIRICHFIAKIILTKLDIFKSDIIFFYKKALKYFRDFKNQNLSVL